MLNRLFNKSKMFASFDGTKLAYTVYGIGKPVILLHGFIIDSRIDWNSFLPRFRRIGRQIVTLDARGHGRSE